MSIQVKVGKAPEPVIITKELESMPKLEGQESSILPAEEPPNYDQSEYEEKESQLWVRIRSFEISKKNLKNFL